MRKLCEIQSLERRNDLLFYHVFRNKKEIAGLNNPGRDDELEAYKKLEKYLKEINFNHNKINTLKPAKHQRFSYQYIENISNEVKSCIDMPELNYIIDSVIYITFSEGCDIMLCTSKPSEYRRGNGYCFICLDARKEEKLWLLWDLLHELGHHLDPMKISKEEQKDEVKVYRRENEAWKLADRTFQRYGSLAKYSDSYQNYKKKCLSSYDRNPV
ncbi:hypothetical protein RCC89_14520 [Cytophagaceae bacterium ABcell3]|nr:hypothetical protein RCC89_14520 [Cytophagaceae bacterium ABcell3]